MTDAARQAQVRAADPDVSYWVSANAGSGKTRVLIDRVVRLLFGGTLPQRILCLTYTKAAAAEMQNRLFKQLGGWAMMAEPELRKELADLGVEGQVTAAEIARARRLFAQAIETPGGLRIQTIHSFCASLLRRFPLEAGVAPGFSEMDDAQTLALRASVLEDIALSDHAHLLDSVAGYLSDDGLMALVQEICGNRAAFEGAVRRDDLLAAVGLPVGFDADHIVKAVFVGGEADLAAAIIPLLRQSGPTDQKTAQALADADLARPSLKAVVTLEGNLLFKSGENAGAAKIGKVPTAAAKKPLAPYQEQLDALMRRVEAARPSRIALAAADRAAALHAFAGVFLPRYEARKAERGFLDFDDLIRHAAALVTDHSVAQWVLYRLDGGLDHILVDEAQDTSPAQWQVIERLSEEFTAGHGARNAGRTVFVVGDKKQSIYSFQGADLGEFDRMRAQFDARLGPQGNWKEGQLEHSFRSAHSILQLVDLTFTAAHHRAIGGKPMHLAYDLGRPGRVDLWEPEPPEPPPEPGDYFDPVFLQSVREAEDRLAERIAREIAEIIASGTRVTLRKGEVKRVDEGDILILVRRRTHLFHPIIRACKKAGLRVAGSDRLRLAGELAVKDLAALLAFLALPEDDLSLASALKSPLFGWTEQQLFDLSARRREKTYLWQALRERADDFPDTLAMLEDLRDRAEFLRPFELIERALTRFDMRRRLVARLGPEAEEGIDELLSQALAYESAEIPTLTGFLVRLHGNQVDARRRFEAGAKALRVMTVHGAKGLEAPIVILPDTAKPKKAPVARQQILLREGAPALWRVPKDVAPPELSGRADALARKLEEERLRLLYVAMTRAESWLIVAAAGDVGKADDSWYSMIRDGMELAGAGAPTTGAEAPYVLRLSNGAWPDPDTSAIQTGEATGVTRPQWLDAPAPTTQPAEVSLSPSGLPGAKTIADDPGTADEAARLRGTHLHALLEHLPHWPEDDWPEIGRSLLLDTADPADPAETDTILAEAARILSTGVLAPFLGSDTLAEVEVSGRVPELGNRHFTGAIDRLRVRDDGVTVLDYKSNAIVPATPQQVPEGILRQMGVYGSLLSQVYPGRVVRLAILWTRTGEIMELPPEIVRYALAATPIP